MIYWIEYDDSGQILGRFGASDNSQFPKRNYMRINANTFHSAPETWAVVNLQVKKLKVQMNKTDPRQSKDQKE